MGAARGCAYAFYAFSAQQRASENAVSGEARYDKLCSFTMRL